MNYNFLGPNDPRRIEMVFDKQEDKMTKGQKGKKTNIQKDKTTKMFNTLHFD